jgi:hypothetical protein
VARVITYSIPTTAGPLAPTAAKRAKPDDDYRERILKYIPGETLAFFVPASAAAAAADARAHLLALVIGIVGNVLYLRWTARRLPKGKRVLPHYYWLSTWAFLIWAFTTSAPLVDSLPSGLLFGIPNSVSVGIVLLATVFLTPVVDDELAARGI